MFALFVSTWIRPTDHGVYSPARPNMVSATSSMVGLQANAGRIETWGRIRFLFF
jgi:hypothetical protein